MKKKQFDLKFKYIKKKIIKPNMEEFMERLKQKVTVGLVGGSDLVKILEQLGGNHGKNYQYYYTNY